MTKLETIEQLIASLKKEDIERLALWLDEFRAEEWDGQIEADVQAGKLDGFAMRVPTINVSIVDLCFLAKRATTVEEVNSAVEQASKAELKGILEYNKDPLVSVDFNHNPASSVFDSTLTKVSEGTLVKVCSWYDNEWGFSNRMLDTTVAFVNAK